MAERNVDEAVLLDLIETGMLRRKDTTHLWLSKHIVGRDDNLLCVAAMIQATLVVKTVMHRFSWSEPQ